MANTSDGIFPEPRSGIYAVGIPPKPVIKMYTRRVETSDPDVKGRIVSLNPVPDRASMDDLLRMGFSFDGDSVTLGVMAGDWMVWRTDKGALTTENDANGRPCLEPLNEHEGPVTLAHSLHNVQKTVVDWLRRLGYDVKLA